jgi:hypothetical protein
MVMNPRLSSCDKPDDDAAVYGILAGLFMSLPPAVRSEHYEDVLRAAGFCFIGALNHLTVERLIEMGVPLGHALMLHAIVHIPPPPDTPSPNRGPRNETAAAPPPPRRMRLRSFPACGTSGVPTHSAWRAFVLAMCVVLRCMNLDRVVIDGVLVMATTHTNVRR